MPLLYFIIFLKICKDFEKKTLKRFSKRYKKNFFHSFGFFCVERVTFSSNCYIMEVIKRGTGRKGESTNGTRSQRHHDACGLWRIPRRLQIFERQHGEARRQQPEKAVQQNVGQKARRGRDRRVSHGGRAEFGRHLGHGYRFRERRDHVFETGGDHDHGCEHRYDDHGAARRVQLFRYRSLLHRAPVYRRHDGNAFQER